jgi:hypothetical protein
LYSANWGIIGASLTFKVRAPLRLKAALRAERVRPQLVTGVAFFAYAYLTRAKFGAPHAARAARTRAALLTPRRAAQAPRRSACWCRTRC